MDSTCLRSCHALLAGPAHQTQCGIHNTNKATENAEYFVQVKDAIEMEASTPDERLAAALTTVDACRRLLSEGRTQPPGDENRKIPEVFARSPAHCRAPSVPSPAPAKPSRPTRPSPPAKPSAPTKTPAGSKTPPSRKRGFHARAKGKARKP
jgi:hypothetical protein